MHTNFTNRDEKQQFIAEKFKDILKKSVLDVGADEGYIKKYMPEGVAYKGIGLGGENPDIVAVNLEENAIPFDNGTFETVMCMDVLEHLENIHHVFKELCRVSSKNVLISLPNPLGDLMGNMRKQNHKQHQLVKFYGLPVEKPNDRHKWFFSATEAQYFVSTLAEECGYEIHFYEQSGLHTSGLKALARKVILQTLRLVIKNKEISYEDIFGSTLWWVLKKKDK